MDGRSPALNPASTPFFPGGRLGREEDSRGAGLGFRLNRDSSTSSVSISPSDYRSVQSTPSPPQDELEGRFTSAPQDYVHHVDDQRGPSPSVHHIEADRPYPVITRPSTKESSMHVTLETIPDTEDGLEHLPMNNTLLHSTIYASVMGRSRERLNTPPVLPEPNSRSSSFQTPSLMSSSPPSSMDSSVMPYIEISNTLESHLKASPLINDILDRMLRFESTTREIQRDLKDVHRKLDVLMDSRTANINAPPEFRDPFASNHGLPSSFPGALANGPRGSIIGNIAPNQQAPPPDEMSTISNRLNSLSVSVDQLVQLSTQQFQVNNAGLGPLAINNSPNPMEIMHNRMIPPAAMGPPSALGNGMPSRPDMRANPRLPGAPTRTWSTGNLDIPSRVPENGTPGLGRPDSALRDKRRSVSAFRRDSSGGESLAGSQMSRDGGPMITKWEQLNIAPELLRSLTAFGVGPPNKIQQRALPFLLRGSDIIAQAPPTQERIAAYVIPAIHTALTYSVGRVAVRGPSVVMISTTVDQATQAQRMIRDLGGPIGVRSALGVGATSANSDLSAELQLLHQNMPHIICGTPQKLHALFTSHGGIPGGEVRFLVLDEVDQLIARNLHDFVFQIVRLLPQPRSRPLSSGTPTTSANGSQGSFSNFDNGSLTSLNGSLQNVPRRFSTVSPAPSADISQIERQTALFSNTVPQDVLNLATTIQLREPVRVLVRRDGNVTHADTNQGARGLRQFYLYLAFTASGRSEQPLPQGSLGIIGSGRGASSAETVQAREWKLDALADLFSDLEVPQAIVHVGGMVALEAVLYKLASRGLEPVPLHNDMNTAAKSTALGKFRNPTASMMRQATTKVLVVYDVPVKPPDVNQVPLIINYDLPKAVEEYAHRVAPAIAPAYSRAGVVVNFVTATGGDVEMLRSIECFYKIKCPEVPISLRDIV
ncbi:hypothetical protein QCA50_000269 [Cerrena zonata]|uniref:RNA helicase n=1 Tax=Cerrena zonata TaxID=2478898 RepID=A0AAW0GQF6_9APHY